MSKRKGLSKETKELYTSLGRSLFLCFVVFFTIMVATAAWFVNNSMVNSNGVSISHQQEKIVLATKGYRQQGEMDILNLSDGTLIGENIETENEKYFCVENGEIALRLSEENVTISPGMSGEITFYIIPEKNGSQTVSLYLGMSGYKMVKDDNNSLTGEKINDVVLNSLLCGRILLFKDAIHSEWIRGKISVSEGLSYKINATNENAQAGVPWPITIYWIWPLRYENMIEDFNSNSDISNYISSQSINLTNIPNTDYSYSQIFLTKDFDAGKNELPENKRSNAYNYADEYIGKNTDYLYVTIQTDLTN